MKSKSFLSVLACPLFVGTASSFLLLSPAGPGLTRCTAAEAAEAEGMEVLTRGPVHEAFAETVVFKPTPGILAAKAPPAAIEELPPEQRPEGANVTWIPGYWMWDDEGNEYLWVSGIWRNLPPGRQWVPGYWNETGEQFQWVSGYWADAAVQEVQYLPEPPASVEAGPNVERPSDDSIWISGSWRWNENRYGWRPGYWDYARPDWVWTPAHYVWTHHGYIFVDGYWDYSVDRRGLIFAPVRFAPHYYSRPGYYYQPSVVISLGAFVNHLFLRPRCRHYYFGDYYDPGYRNSGYYASYSYYSGGYGYDPIYAHQRWNNRNDNRWERRRAEDFRYFRDNRDERPPRTFAEYSSFAAARKDGDRRIDSAFASPLTQFVSRKEGQGQVKFKPVNAEEKERFVGRSRQMREFGMKRKELAREITGTTAETPDKGRPGKGGSAKVEPAKVKLPTSPIVSTTENRAKEDTPPERSKAAVINDSTAPPPNEQPGRQGQEKRGEGKKDGPPTGRRGLPRGDQPRTKPGEAPGDTPTVEPGVEPKDLPKRDPKVEPKDQPGREPKTEPKVEPRETPKREPRRGPKEEPTVEPKREPKADPPVEPKPEPKVEPKVEPKREPKVEPKREPKVEEPRRGPKKEPEVRAKPQPKIEERDLPQVQRPREQPKVKERDLPQVQRPREQPKAQPREQPRVQPREQPKAQPREQPRAQPREQPKPSGEQPQTRKDRPKKDSEEKKKK